MNDVMIEMVNPPGMISIAKSLIDRFKIKNNIQFELHIKLDYNINDMGLYYPYDEPNTIYVNPDLAMTECDILYNDSESAHGYCNDNSIISNTIHEFSHFLYYTIYTTLLQDYKDLFNKRLYLCEYSLVSIEEELAEIMRLYIINPFLLKMVSVNVYKFIKKYFKSPSPYSQKHATNLYEDYSKSAKLHLSEHWGVVIVDGKLIKQ